MANNVLIFGDSYSTFEGYIPEGYGAYYPTEESIETNVRYVEETWWHQVISEIGGSLILNNSWSGSTIGHTGYNGQDCSGFSSFIFRFRELKEKGFFTENKIDTVFVFGGTNDSWSDAPVGKIKLSDWVEKDLFFVLPAVAYFLHDVKNTLPEAKVYCLINTELKPEIMEGMAGIAKASGVTPITFNNIEKCCGHPTVQGMIDIKNQVMSVIEG